MNTKRKVSISDGQRYIAAFGNKNILNNHVYYFEKLAKAEIDNNRTGAGKDVSFTEYPNFVVWLRLYSEYISNALYWKAFLHEGDKEIFKPGRKSGFRSIRESVIKKIEDNNKATANAISEEEMKLMKKSINLVLNLRHSFQHGGLPNLLRDLSDNCDEMEFYNMLIPNNFLETKKIFKQAEALVKLLPQPTVVCYAK
jgi:hypothetical protein